MKYPLACDTWDDREIEAIQKVIKSGRYTMGPHVKQFEKEFARHFMCKDAVMVNSGSTANLLMLATLAEKYKLSPYQILGRHQLPQGGDPASC